MTHEELVMRFRDFESYVRGEIRRFYARISNLEQVAAQSISENDFRNDLYRKADMDYVACVADEIFENIKSIKEQLDHDRESIFKVFNFENSVLNGVSNKENNECTQI